MIFKTRTGKYQLLAGSYDYYAGTSSNASELDISFLEKISEELCNGSKDYTNALTYRSFQMLKKALRPGIAMPSSTNLMQPTQECLNLSMPSRL